MALASGDGTIFLVEDGEVASKIKSEGDRLIGIARFGLGFVLLTDAHKILLYESPEGLSSAQPATTRRADPSAFGSLLLVSLGHPTESSRSPFWKGRGGGISPSILSVSARHEPVVQ